MKRLTEIRYHKLSVELLFCTTFVHTIANMKHLSLGNKLAVPHKIKTVKHNYF